MVYDTASNRPILALADPNGGSITFDPVVGVFGVDAQVNPLTKESFIGFAQNTAAIGETVTVHSDGFTDANQTGLTAGQSYYAAATDGSLGTTPGNGAVFVGTALSATEIRVASDDNATKFFTDNSGVVSVDGTDSGFKILGDTKIQSLMPEIEFDATSAGSSNGNMTIDYHSGFGVGQNGWAINANSDGEGLYTNLRIEGNGTALANFSPSSLVGINFYDTTKVEAAFEAKSYRERVQTVTRDSGTSSVTFDCSTGNNFVHTLAANGDVILATNIPSSGLYTMSVELIQDAAGSGYIPIWLLGTNIYWPSATAPTLTNTASAVDVFVFTTRDGGTTWYGFTAGQALG